MDQLYPERLGAHDEGCDTPERFTTYTGSELSTVLQASGLQCIVTQLPQKLVM
jgi:hypothetical protein